MAGEIIPAPLACAASRTAPEGSMTSSEARLGKASVVRIESAKAPSPSAASSPAALRQSLDHAVGGQLEAR